MCYGAKAKRRKLNSVGYREPIVYNSKVFAAICRQVYKAEKLAPPTQLATWANAYSYIWARATNVGWWRNILKTGGWVGLGIGVSSGHGYVIIDFADQGLLLSALLSYFSRTISLVRLLSTPQAVEAYGIFTIGEMIGRRNVVGYKLKD